MKFPFSALALGLLVSATTHAATITYDFEDVALGQVQTFNVVKGGVVASFSTTDSSGLHVYLNSGSFLPFPFMGQAVSNGTGFPINIGFSTLLDSASLDFGTNNLAVVSTLVTLKAYRGGPGGLLLATTSVTGVPGLSQFPQGSINILAPGFDTLVLSAQQPGLAMDNLRVSTVPEPDSLSLLLVSGFIIWNYRQVKRRL